MARFYPLTVTDIRPETRDAVVVTLSPAESDREKFRFIQGQYLTFRNRFEGEELRRSYSICSSPDDGVMRVAIKRVADGWFSTWANRQWQRGMVVDAMPPQGRFFAPLVPDSARHYLMVALGSGITPVLSNIRTVLAREPHSRVSLVYANRAVASIMFREELEDLKDTYLDRFSVTHVLKSDALEVDLFTGRLDAAKCEALFDEWIDVSGIDLAFICGPESMMLTVTDVLLRRGLAREKIRFELFNTAPRGTPPVARIRAAESEIVRQCRVSATLEGITREFNMPMDGTRVVDAVRAAGIDAPFSCKAGVCSTCRARVLEGEVEMEANYALEDYEVRGGYALTCQSRPLTDRLVLTYDV